MEQRNLLVGYDLCDDFSGISCFNPKTFEPESICIGKDGNKFLIPTVVGVNKGTKEWVYGEEAIALEKEGNGVIVSNLLEKVRLGEEVTVLGTIFNPVTLLEKFLKKTLLLLKTYYPSNNIQKIVITVKKLDKKLISGIYTALMSLGIEKDRAFIQSHNQSYEYYALSQPKELWMNDVGLFDFDEEGLFYSQISIARNTPQNIVSTTNKDFTEILSYAMLLEESEERISSVFLNIAKSVLHKQIISTIYVTGKGFEGDWSNDALIELCKGKRIFKGNNLYTRGACFAARELADNPKLNEFIFLGDEMVKYSLALQGYFNAKSSEIMLMKGTSNWYDVDEKLYVILDEEDCITVTLRDAWNRDKRIETLKLDGIPKRPNKTTRIEIRLKCLNSTTVILTAKDQGFGEFYPSSHRIWEKEIKISCS
jgi:hypothetical protein